MTAHHRKDDPRMIDWDLAVRVGGRLGGDGPAIPPEQAQDCVAELREGAAKSSPLVRDVTGLVAEEHTAPVLVVDRRGWVQANADGFAALSAPLLEQLQERKGPPSGMTEAVGSRVTGVELGVLLGFLAGKVLGQFDPFYTTGGAGGRLLLVAPNIVHVEQELDVDPHDFRLWVCLHEETHRVQFTAVGWLRDHLEAEMAAIVGTISTDPTALLADVVRRVGDLVTGRTDPERGPTTDSGQGGSLLDLLSTPEQREIVDRITGVMSLLEGHADVVMDDVGPEVIGSVAEIRRKFTKRRGGVGTLDRLLRRLLGLDQKMAQYRDGAAFVRSVVDRTGMEGFNAVWSGPDALPGRAEILDPDSWIRRVHG